MHLAVDPTNTSTGEQTQQALSSSWYTLELKTTNRKRTQTSWFHTVAGQTKVQATQRKDFKNNTRCSRVELELSRSRIIITLWYYKQFTHFSPKYSALTASHNWSYPSFSHFQFFVWASYTRTCTSFYYKNSIGPESISAASSLSHNLSAINS